MIAAVLMAGVPLALAATGGLISERSAVLNISLEGCIGAGAFAAAVVLALGGHVLWALAAVVFTGLLLGGLLAAVHLGLGANLFIAGLGINLLTPSLSGLVSRALWNHKGIIFFDAPRMLNAPWLMIPVSFALLAVLFRTELGRRIRAVETQPQFLQERAVPPNRTRILALLSSSVAAALAGFHLVLRIGAFVPGMSAGRGWIALVLIWMGFRNPVGVLAAAYFFAFSEIVSGRIQGLFQISSTFNLAVPSILALTVLTVATIIRRHRNTEMNGDQ